MSNCYLDPINQECFPSARPQPHDSAPCPARRPSARGFFQDSPNMAPYRPPREPHFGSSERRRARWKIIAWEAIFILALFLFLPYFPPAEHERSGQAHESDGAGTTHWLKALGKQNMNSAGQIAVTAAALIGFGRLFLANDGDSHRLSGFLILAGVLGKVALSI